VHNDASGFADLVVGRELGPLVLTISADANERFWRAAGCEPRAVLYPPIAAQLAIMLTRAAIAPAEVLHAAQSLRNHAIAAPGTELRTVAAVVERYEKRGRDYVVVEAATTTAAGPLWSGRSTFCGLR